MARVHRQRREHRENFLLKITPCPGCALRAQFPDMVQVDVVLPQERLDLLVPERVLLRHHLMDHALDGFKDFRWAHPVGAHVARFARDLLLNSGDTNFAASYRSLDGCVGEGLATLRKNA
jgi:hypothetical protein